MDSKQAQAPVFDAVGSPRLLAQRDDWVRHLMDFSRRNRLIYYRDLKRGTLCISEDLSSEPARKLAAGDAVPLSDFFSDGVTTTEIAKAKEIRSVARSNEEERGLQTLFVAMGFARWKANDDGSPANAPMFLLPASVMVNERTGQVSLKCSGDLVINRVMLAKLSDEYKIQVDTLFFDDEEGVAALYCRLVKELSAVPGFTSSPKCVLGNFDYQKMAMVEDLRNNEKMLAENELVAAIAGDEEARAAIALSQRSVNPRDLDSIPARDEPFVLDADGSQQVVLHSALQYPAHTVILGPPGTGKSQTISNLIAALIATGKSVLFVAEKRAALEVVFKRLDQAGLGHLVLDLHGGDVKRKTIYERLRHSDETARKAVSVDGAQEERKFEEARDALNKYEVALHKQRPPFNLSAFEAFSKLATLAAVEARTRWRGPSITQFSDERKIEVSKELSALSSHCELAKRAGGVPWSQAEFDDEGARSALSTLGDLQGQLFVLPEKWANLLPTVLYSSFTIADLREAIARLGVLNEAVSIFGASICSLDVDSLDKALAPARGNFIERISARFKGPLRKSCRGLRALNPSAWPGLIRAAATVHRLAELPSEWRTQVVAERVESVGTPDLVLALKGILENHTELSRQTKVDLPRALDDLSDSLVELQRSSRSASVIPALREAETNLRRVGCGGLLDELFKSGLPGASWLEVFQKAWLASVLEQIVSDDRVLATFQGSSHNGVVEAFRRLDRERTKLMAVRIRRTAAEQYIKTMNEYATQRTAVQLELNKKIRHTPLRKLMLSAPDVLTAICPCFMASPLSVSQLLPARVLFDVVIFDEGSQILPEDAVPAIIRGKHAVIAGDPRQLPPTAFFAASDRDDDAEVDELDTAGMESILDLLTPFVEPRPLTWHYRSTDERLIAFSNTHIYADRLLTLPGTGKDGDRIVHEYVPPQLVDGLETSAPAEVQRVVELILQHAQTRPNESLGVIAMGIKHARRIEEALSSERAIHPELDEFFSEDRDDRFFVKNLERVQGDERDAIILSVGYGPDRSGKMVYRFGPINQLGGERRLNVAITRARNRMTVVSSFRQIDLDPERLKSEGAKLLGAFVGYAETSGKNLGREGANSAVELNDFEQDVMDALSHCGLAIVPQYGVSNYRIDLAVKHPKHPGQFVLAVECDGATYHSAPTARNRDRLRQQHLEALGWKFHRIWSTEWFYNREKEIERAMSRYEQCANGESKSKVIESTRAVSNKTTNENADESNRVKQARPEKPALFEALPIDEYDSADLYAMLQWIESDGVLRTDDELISELVKELGYRRRGPRIMERLAIILAGYHQKKRSG